jgi:hypothetical protein
MVLALVALFVAPLALSPFAQSAHSAAAVTGGGRVRDLGVATPESVGVSTERVHRIEAAMKKLVDDKQVAGLVTLLERHGKVIAFNAVGQKDVPVDIEAIGNVDVITVAIGLLSAIVDNVPLVAAAQGMYSLTTFPTDHHFWLFLCYCAGTGGSILIIGSAAGIAVMGIQRITFGWYVRHLSLPALLGYAAGALTYVAFAAR